jgi:hypothetical protein
MSGILIAEGIKIPSATQMRFGNANGNGSLGVLLPVLYLVNQVLRCFGNTWQHIYFLYLLGLQNVYIHFGSALL